MVIAEKKKARE
jgi:hypothetical protein